MFPRQTGQVDFPGDFGGDLEAADGDFIREGEDLGLSPALTGLHVGVNSPAAISEGVESRLSEEGDGSLKPSELRNFNGYSFLGNLSLCSDRYIIFLFFKR